MRLLALALALSTALPASAATLLIGNKAENTVSFIDLATGKERARLPTGPMPHEIAISPDGNTAAVVAYGAKQIDFYDVAAAKHLKAIDLGTNLRPHGIAWLKSGGIVATTEGSSTLSLVDPVSGKVDSIATGAKGSHMVTVTADESRAFVTNLGSRNISALDLVKRTKISDLSAGEEPEGLSLTPDGKELWVANRAEDTVMVFDAKTLAKLATVKVGDMPIRLQVSPDGKTAVTSNFFDGTLTLIDVASRKVTRTVPVSGGKDAAQVTIMFASDGQRIYVAETGKSQVAEVELSTGKVLRHLPAGQGADGLGYSPIG
ncbi:YncE family protein [Sphingoaurantiacus capsulatus]|uniref:YncE family protein n=1 Tax=Sphingoaurantiacus capsulatus TaxID=1771310 RepID=A0ABV7XBG0_9SPHN